MTNAAAYNRELGLKINRDIWNGRQFDKIPEYFAEAFVRQSSAPTRRSTASVRRSRPSSPTTTGW